VGRVSGLLPSDLATARLSFTTTGTRDEAIAHLSDLVERSPRFFAETWTGEVSVHRVRVQHVPFLRLFAAPLHFEGHVTEGEPAVLEGRFVADEMLPFTLVFFGSSFVIGVLLLAMSGLVPGSTLVAVGAGLGGLGALGLILTFVTRPLWRREAALTEAFLQAAVRSPGKIHHLSPPRGLPFRQGSTRR
jgi:hypothetical protein